MANQYYQFAFTFSPAALTTSFQTQGASGWTAYQEPNFTHGQVRTGGPNNSNNPNGPSGNYLVANAGDSVFINLVGPAGWSLPPGGLLQLIVSQANSPGNSQGFTPFPYVYYALTGTMLADAVTMQFKIPDPIASGSNPGQGNFNRYELTIAVAVLDSSRNLYYFADDPEMDVQGAS